jgi:hypothetical protein
MLGQLRQESRGVAAKSTKFRDCKGYMERLSGRLLTPSEYFSNLVFSARRRATSGDGGLETPNTPEATGPRHQEIVLHFSQYGTPMSQCFATFFARVKGTRYPQVPQSMGMLK